MGLNLSPVTAAGEAFVAAAQGVIPALREHAAEADRNSAMPVDSFKALQQAGLTAAFVPQALGGMGLTSIHDWMVGIATLAQGDGSVAIAVNMHLGVSRGMSQAYYAAEAAGKATDAVAKPLSAIQAGQMLISATATERGTDNLHPLTTAEQNPEGWLINGHKMFVTMSPIATHLAMNLRMQDEAGEHLASTMLPINTPGIEPQDDWDALGMRGSGSQSIKFTNVQVPQSAVRRLGPWGRWSVDSLINRTLGNLVLVGAFFGIASHARELARTSVPKQQRLGRPVADSAGVQQTMGELEITYATCRGLLQQTGRDVDAWLADAKSTPPTIEAAHELLQTYQAAKWVVNRGAIEVVDKAMDLCGGAGYVASNPLTRLYRDVRAGPFMQPLAATEIRQYVGQVALGIYPES